MKYWRFGYFFLLTVLIAVLSGCSDGNHRAPVSPSTGYDILQLKDEGYQRSFGRVLWGLYEITIDTRTLEAGVCPLRSAEFNVNVTQFMQPPISPTNRISVYVDPGASNLPEGLFAVDVTLHHPFPGLSQYSGFDVRGIFMGDGSIESQQYNNLLYAGENQSRLLNADGWTRWWNPTEFTTYGTIFGYTKGSLSTPKYTANATLNPFKYFCDGLGAQDPFNVSPESRGFFSMTSSNTRRYMIQFAMDGGSPSVKYNYAVDASWEMPSGSSPYTKDNFSLSANCQEAYKISIADAGSTAWYESPTKNGGNLVLDITVYDWQGSANPQGVPGEVKAIWVESPTLLDNPVNVLPGATVSPDGPTSSVFHVEISNVSPTGLTKQRLLVGVESAKPASYAPNLDGVSGFVYPDEPLAAYMFWDAPILDKEPVQIPAPTGLDNCDAAGIVKLFWNPVVWPTLAGYNVYRKLSTEPSYNFSSPINGTLLTETQYWDTSVLMNGTTYDYVVRAVDLDTSQSVSSNQTSATPQYIPPTGFTDLDNPDLILSNTAPSNFTNSWLTPNGTFYATGGMSPYLVKGNFATGVVTNQYSIGGGSSGGHIDVAVDSNGNAHVVYLSSWYSSPQTYRYAMVTPTGSVQYGAQIHSCTFPNTNPPEVAITVTPDDKVHMFINGYIGTTYDITYIQGTPGNFAAPVIVTTNVVADQYHIRQDCASDRFGNIHLVWTGPSYSNIMYMKRNPDGSWTSPVIASTGVGSTKSFAAVAADIHGTVHVAWTALGGGQMGYSNNSTGSFVGQIVPGAVSGNIVGVACDRDGNAYVNWWTSTGAMIGLALYSRTGTLITSKFISDTDPTNGSWCTMCGIVDPCYSSNMSVMSVWRNFSTTQRMYASRIRTDY